MTARPHDAATRPRPDLATELFGLAADRPRPGLAAGTSGPSGPAGGPPLARPTGPRLWEPPRRPARAPLRRPRGIAVVGGRLAPDPEEADGVAGLLADVARALPTADVHVLWSDPGRRPVPGTVDSRLAGTPLRGHEGAALAVAPLVWRTQTRRRYDVVLAVDHAFHRTPRLRTHPGGVHLAYVTVPAPYVWLPELDAPVSGLAAAPATALAYREGFANRHVTEYAVASEAVRARVRRFWRRDARVLPPPCRTEFFAAAPAHLRGRTRDHLLVAGPWLPGRRLELAMDVAARAGVPLVLAGSGPAEPQLRRYAMTSGADVRFDPAPTAERLRRLLCSAQALLQPWADDFGVVPVQAQACGTPVLGPARGGLTETVAEGLTGYLVPDADDGAFVAALADRVRWLDSLDADAARRHAERFGAEAFAVRLHAWLDDATGAPQ